MAEYSTRISDLPDTQIQEAIGQNTYAPINPHPNPYGLPPQPPNGSIPYPQSSPQRNQASGPGQGQGPMPQYENIVINQQQQPNTSYDPTVQQPQQQYRLPSRDIPMNQLEFQQDPEIQPNYIPKAKLTSDYIRDYEAASEETLKKHERGKHREQVATDLFSQMQIPILVAVLFFIFQMPIVNTLLRKYFTFLKVYNEDGNLNFTGLIVKSAMFGSAFYSAQNLATYLSTI